MENIPKSDLSQSRRSEGQFLGIFHKFCLFWPQTLGISLQFSFLSIPKISKHDSI